MEGCHHRTSSFNPRPREGGDLTTAQQPRFPLVSIRAPVKGAIIEALDAYHSKEVSIRAPVKGAMIKAASTLADLVFQSAPP